MSHFSTVKTRICDERALVAALADLGFKTVETHTIPQALRGYQNDLRTQAAHVIIRKKYVGSGSNDIGFRRQPDGFYEAFISEFDQSEHKYNERWMQRLMQRYAYHVTINELSAQGFSLIQTEQANGEMVLTLTK